MEPYLLKMGARQPLDKLETVVFPSATLEVYLFKIIDEFHSHNCLINIIQGIFGKNLQPARLNKVYVL